MGSNVSRGWAEFKDPESMPTTHMPPRFDPMYGFPQGRKKREMKATDEELEYWEVPLVQRDYCAHIMLDFMKCRRKNWPYANIYCHQLKHSWETCQVEDQILRMKEWERERRLLAKERRLKAKQEQEQSVQQITGGGDEKASGDQKKKK